MLVVAGEPGRVLGVEHAVRRVADLVGKVTASGVLKGRGPEGVVGVEVPDDQAVLVGEQVGDRGVVASSGATTGRWNVDIYNSLYPAIVLNKVLMWIYQILYILIFQ